MYKQFPPPSQVAQYVESIWMLSTGGAIPGRRRAIYVNEGISELAIQLREPSAAFTDPGGEFVPKQSVTGFMTRPCHIGFSSRVRAVGIRFRPGGLAPYSGVPSDEYLNRILDTRDVLNPELLRRLEGIETCDSDEEIVRQVRSALREGIVAPDPEPFSAIRHFVNAHRNGLLGSIEEFCQHGGIALWQLERWFRSLIGIPPSRFARVLRFRRVLCRMASEPAARWIDVAADCGYADQAHLSREFKEFVGVPPSRFAARGVSRRTSERATGPLFSLVAGANAVSR